MTNPPIPDTGHGDLRRGQPSFAAPAYGWTPEPVSAYAQPAHGGPAPSSAPTADRSRPGGVRLAAVALVAALIGGGVSATALTALHPSSAVAGGTSTTTTRVVQGATSAPDWTVTAAAAAPSVVSIQVTGASGQAEGSGVVLDDAGHVVTNNHVVTGVGAGAQLQVTLADRRVYAATVVGTDPATDLAVVQLNDATNLQPIAVGDVGGLKVGQPVMALGNPLGLSQTVTTGIISALDRPVITQQEAAGPARSAGYQAQQAVANAIQTNAAINPGNSGGALVDADGRLIGITSSIATLGSGSQSGSGQSGNIGIGFAIPANEVTRVAHELISGGQATHAYLGVATSDGTGTANGSTVLGAVVNTVAGQTPAEQAGLRAGDVITAVDGEAVGSSEALMAQIRDHAVGQQVKVTYVRGGRRGEATVTLANQPG